MTSIHPQNAGLWKPTGIQNIGHSLDEFGIEYMNKTWSQSPTVRSIIDSLLDYGPHGSDPCSRSDTNDRDIWIFRQLDQTFLDPYLNIVT